MGQRRIQTFFKWKGGVPNPCDIKRDWLQLYVSPFKCIYRQPPEPSICHKNELKTKHYIVLSIGMQ